MLSTVYLVYYTTALREHRYHTAFVAYYNSIILLSYYSHTTVILLYHTTIILLSYYCIYGNVELRTRLLFYN